MWRVLLPLRSLFSSNPAVLLTPCLSPHRPWYLYPWTSSGPLLIAEDNPVSGSLVSQSKCHSGGLTFSGGLSERRQPPCVDVTPVVTTTDAQSLFVSDRPYFFPLPPNSPAILRCVHLLGFIHDGTRWNSMGINASWQVNIATIKYGWCVSFWLHNGPSHRLDTWCIRSHR